MKTLALIVLLAAFSVPALAKDKNVTVTTDRFTGETTVSMKMFSVGPMFGFQDATQSSLSGATVFLALGAVTTGKTGNPGLLIYITASNWQFLSGTDVHVLADGQPIDLGHFIALRSHVETIGTVTTNEVIAAHVDRAILDRIVNAKDLQMEVGPYAFRVNPKNIPRLKEFYDALPVAVAKKEPIAPAAAPAPMPSAPVPAAKPAPQTMTVIGQQPESLGDYARRMKAEKAARQQ